MGFPTSERIPENRVLSRLSFSYNQTMDHHIHDKFFKKVFSETDNIRDFLTMALPPQLQQEMDLNFLTLDTTSYISEDLEDYFSDLVVHTRLKEEHNHLDI